MDQDLGVASGPPPVSTSPALQHLTSVCLPQGNPHPALSCTPICACSGASLLALRTETTAQGIQLPPFPVHGGLACPGLSSTTASTSCGFLACFLARSVRGVCVCWGCAVGGSSVCSVPSSQAGGAECPRVACPLKQKITGHGLRRAGFGLLPGDIEKQGSWADCRTRSGDFPPPAAGLTPSVARSPKTVSRALMLAVACRPPGWTSHSLYLPTRQHHPFSAASA